MRTRIVKKRPVFFVNRIQINRGHGQQIAFGRGHIPAVHMSTLLGSIDKIQRIDGHRRFAQNLPQNLEYLGMMGSESCDSRVLRTGC